MNKSRAETPAALPAACPATGKDAKPEVMRINTEISVPVAGAVAAAGVVDVLEVIAVRVGVAVYGRHR